MTYFLFFHLVNPSPWPALSALSALSLIVTLVGCFHNYVGSFGESCCFLVAWVFFFVFTGLNSTQRFSSGKGFSWAKKRLSSEGGSQFGLILAGTGLTSADLVWPVGALILALVLWYLKPILDAFARPIDPANHPFVRFPKITFWVWLFWTVWSGDDLASRIYGLFSMYGFLYWGTHTLDYLRWKRNGILPPPPAADFSVGASPMAIPALALTCSSFLGTNDRTFVEAIAAVFGYGLIGWGASYLAAHYLRWVYPHRYTPMDGPKILPFLAMFPFLKRTGEAALAHKAEVVLVGSAAAGGIYMLQEQKKINLAVRTQNFHEKSTIRDQEIKVRDQEIKVRDQEIKVRDQELDEQREWVKFLPRHRSDHYDNYLKSKSFFFAKPYQQPSLRESAEAFHAFRQAKSAAAPPPLSVEPARLPESFRSPPPPGGSTVGTDLPWADMLVTSQGRWNLLGAMVLAVGRILWRWWRGC